MTNNILNGCVKSVVQTAAVAGTTSLNTTVIDMQGFNSVVWDVLFGALTAGQVTSLKAQGGNLPDGSDAVDLAGTSTGPMADADGNKMLSLEVVRPAGFRYLRAVIVRGTQNAVVNGAVATRYHSRKSPTTQDATVSASKTVVSPAAGSP